jgi:hypothetical protein
MINKVAVTPANLTDAKGMALVLPHSSAVYADKGYYFSSKNSCSKKMVHLCAVKKNNMNGKNFDLDKYYTRIRSPFERVFSKDNKRLRYLRIAKNQFAEFMDELASLNRLPALELYITRLRKYQDKLEWFQNLCLERFTIKNIYPLKD